MLSWLEKVLLLMCHGDRYTSVIYILPPHYLTEKADIFVSLFTLVLLGIAALVTRGQSRSLLHLRRTINPFAAIYERISHLLNRRFVKVRKGSF